jgi:hypothetical protein
VAVGTHNPEVGATCDKDGVVILWNLDPEVNISEKVFKVTDDNIKENFQATLGCHFNHTTHEYCLAVSSGHLIKVYQGKKG